VCRKPSRSSTKNCICLPATVLSDSALPQIRSLPLASETELKGVNIFNLPCRVADCVLPLTPEAYASQRRPAKRKRSPSPGDSPAKKRKHQLQASTRCSKAWLDGARRSKRSHTPHSDHCTSSTNYNTMDRLPSPVPSMAHTTDTEMRSSSSESGRYSF
jgi:hypothetical protein